MSSYNRVLIIGNLGKDPELTFTPNGNAVCKFSVATTETWMKDGAKQEKVEWHNIVVWGKTAENCSQYLQKGRSVFVEGKLSTRSWEDKQTGVKKYATEIVAQNVKFLGGNPGAQQSGPAAGSGSSFDDDVPFMP